MKKKRNPHLRWYWDTYRSLPKGSDLRDKFEVEVEVEYDRWYSSLTDKDRENTAGWYWETFARSRRPSFYVVLT